MSWSLVTAISVVDQAAGAPVKTSWHSGAFRVKCKVVVGKMETLTCFSSTTVISHQLAVLFPPLWHESAKEKEKWSGKKKPSVFFKADCPCSVSAVIG